MPLTLEADNLQVIKWWIDGAFATHRDMRSHTGGGGFKSWKRGDNRSFNTTEVDDLEFH